MMFVKHKGSDNPEVLCVEDFVPQNAIYKSFDWVQNKIKNKWQHYQWGKYPDRGPYYMSDLRSMNIGGALRRIDYDLLHLHWINQRFIPLDLLPKDKPIIWTLHDSWPFCGICHLPMDCRGFQRECGCCPALGSDDPHDMSHSIWKKKAKTYNKLNLHIVTPSRWMASCVRSSSLFRNVENCIIPNCIDANLFCPGDRNKASVRMHLDPQRKHILFGAMHAIEDPNKGFRYLQEAIRYLPEDMVHSTDLVLFGSDQKLGEEISGMKVFSLGLIQDDRILVDAYRAADVTVVPSLSENLSCTIMESLACGTPVVAFNIGGNCDMVIHRSNGYLAREKDATDLAEGLTRALGNEFTSVRDIVLERFTPDIVSAQYVNLYQQLAQ